MSPNPDLAHELEAELHQLRRQLEAVSADRFEERRRLTDHVLAVRSELNRLSRQSQDLARRRLVAEEQHRTAIVSLRYERDLARWKLDSTRRRKWWRIGEALSVLRRRPSQLFPVALEVLRIVRGSSRLPPRPVKPAALEAAPAAALEESSPPRSDDRSLAPRRPLAVATAMDAETERQLSFEWVSQPITPENWREVLRHGGPDLLLVDDTGWDAGASGDAAGTPLRALARAFRAAGVPTVFWDTRRIPSTAVPAEDVAPFDLVLCSFASTVEAYRSAAPDAKIHLFGPAVQTRQFRPTPGDRDGGVIGLRSLAAPEGEGPLARAARAVAPSEFTKEEPAASPDASGTATVADTAKDHKAAIVEFSAATDEREIRHLLEVVATKTLVLAGGSVPNELRDIVFEAATAREATEALRTLLRSNELRDRLSHRAWREVRRDHAVVGRVDQLLARIGIDSVRPTPRLAMMIPTNRPHKLEAILDNLARQTHANLAATLVLHGVDLDEGRMRDLAAERGLQDIAVLRVPGDVALGDVFNRGFAACEGDFLGKMDDDDYYGPEYASDLLTAFEDTSADIVGKWTHYAYSDALDATLLRYPGNEHSFQELLAISTLILRPDVLEDVSFLPMEKGSGSQFLREAAAVGARVYAGDRFNYLYNRFSGDGHQHTWPVADYEFAAKAAFICQGQNLAAVEA